MRLQFHPQPAPHLWISQQARLVLRSMAPNQARCQAFCSAVPRGTQRFSTHAPSPAHVYPQREVRDTGLSGATQSARRHALPLPGALPRPPSASFIHKPVARRRSAPGARVQRSFPVHSWAGQRRPIRFPPLRSITIGEAKKTPPFPGAFSSRVMTWCCSITARSQSSSSEHSWPGQGSWP